MESLKELYRIGQGPSSSHTLAPQNACLLFMEHYPNAVFFEVILFGSLALTGKGHSTNDVIRKTFAPRMCSIFFKPAYPARLPNGLIIKGFDAYSEEIKTWTIYSLGGGSIEVEEEDLHLHDEVYPHNSMIDILSYCHDHNLNLVEYVFTFDRRIEQYLNKVIDQMLKTVASGLNTVGLLPGPLKLPRVAKALHLQGMLAEDLSLKQKLSLSAYAYAACEENADGQFTVAAPTMGASGIMAALIYHYYHDVGLSKSKLIKGLAVGGLFGNIVKKNATISGAVGGCQAEVGTACAMGSAMVAFFNQQNDKIINYAAEIGIEHHLGLTCDPVGGYVMIPCIERNVVGTLRAIDSAFLAQHVGAIKLNRVSFDDVVKTMQYTGLKIPVELKETSLGGLAKEVKFDEEVNLEINKKTKDNILERYRDLSDILNEDDDMDRKD
ncbi:MAG: L-serine ammonia-lyase, iron-sulfur-dependent, subunit alpha [Erysipelotrichaceae bacterium]|nr:L-serine ammonia-lyase, iron-sulfur-dependent, subunit alpha [Erysipelotrichaceae bacterium]